MKSFPFDIFYGIFVNVGITSASGISAELGIPLTHRGIANRYLFYLFPSISIFFTI